MSISRNSILATLHVRAKFTPLSLLSFHSIKRNMSHETSNPTNGFRGDDRKTFEGASLDAPLQKVLDEIDVLDIKINKLRHEQENLRQSHIELTNRYPYRLGPIGMVIVALALIWAIENMVMYVNYSHFTDRTLYPFVPPKVDDD